ncbi:MAG: ABC transporter permease [Gammaproteobacteria bacterium]|nr:ABC transporter permease [Gammaproteobacteria bacterium]
MNRRDARLRDESGARDKLGLGTALRTWGLRHAQVFFYSLGQLWRTPLSLLMTATVIGIALALPTGLHVLLQNAQRLSDGWDGAAKISVFFGLPTLESQVRKVQTDIQQLPEVANVVFISREQALSEFKQQSGFGEALNALTENPLPQVLVVSPKSSTEPTALDQLVERLRALPQVEYVQLDRQWVKRLFAIMAIASRGIDILGGMLALGVVLVIGNTIRLAIQNRREEIVVIKLIGGTDAFIRRPFLYTGFWYGLAGGIMALVFIDGAIALLSGPVERLAGLYHTPFRLYYLDLITITQLLGVSIGLGWMGSWLAVGRHLRAIEPR